MWSEDSSPDLAAPKVHDLFLLKGEKELRTLGFVHHKMKLESLQLKKKGNLSNGEQILTMVLKLMNTLRSVSLLMACFAPVLGYLGCVLVNTGAGLSPSWSWSFRESVPLAGGVRANVSDQSDHVSPDLDTGPGFKNGKENSQFILRN